MLGMEMGNQLSNTPAAMSYKQRGSAFVDGPLFRDSRIITGATHARSAIVRIGLSLADLMKSMMMTMLYNPWGEGIYRLHIVRGVSGRTTRGRTWYHGVKKSMTCHGTRSGALSHRPDPGNINISSSNVPDPGNINISSFHNTMDSEHINISRNDKSNSRNMGRE